MIVIGLFTRNQLVIFRVIYIVINCNSMFTIIKNIIIINNIV